MYLLYLCMNSKNTRTGATWLKDLMGSVRFKIAVLNLEEDPQFMLAILTEVMLETQENTKAKLKKIYAKNFEANKAIMLELFDRNTDYSGYTRPWTLTPTEQKLYVADPHFQLTEKQRSQLLNVVKNSMMNPKHLTEDVMNRIHGKQESPEE